MQLDKNYLQALALKTLTLENYRGFKQVQIEFDTHLTVISGTNGLGKSSILEALAVLIHKLSARIENPRARGRELKDSDIFNGSAYCKIGCTWQWHMPYSLEWEISKSKYQGKTMAFKPGPSLTLPHLLDFNGFAAILRENIEAQDGNFPLPVLAYYGVNRSVIDIPLRIRKKHRFSVNEANEGAIESNSTHFRAFFEWFRMREDLENERRRDAENLFSEKAFEPDVQLEAVRNAVYAFLPGSNHLKIKRSPLRMVLTKTELNQEFNISQLSDGEKCVLALFGDLARRLALANPHLKNPLEGKAIVLIDELDLHLHPKWQRQVILKLNEVFPNSQFVVSTHSPQMLGEVKPEQIILLNRNNNGVIEIEQPQYSKGLSSNSILQELMQTSERNLQVSEKYKEVDHLIAAEDFDKALFILDEIAEMGLGQLDPKQVELRSLIDFLKVL